MACAHQALGNEVLIAGDDGVAVHSEPGSKRTRPWQSVTGVETTGANVIREGVGKLLKQR